MSRLFVLAGAALSLALALLISAGPAMATTYYVSTSGNDANDGLSTTTPWQTITKVNSAKFLPGQTLAFNGGNNFTGCLVISSGTNLQSSSITSPFTITSYGTGVATILSNCPGHDVGIAFSKAAAVTIDGVSGIVWNKVNVSANNTLTQYGILVQSSKGATADTITIENSVISGFHIDNTATGDDSSEIALLGYATNGACGPLNHISILNNTLAGASGVGSPDDAGIDGYGCNASANILNVSNVLYQGNTIYNLGGRPGVLGGFGIVLNSVNGGTAQYNLVHDVGTNVNTCGGPGGIYDYNANNVVIQYNEVYNMTFSTANGAHPCDAAAYDIDNGTTNTTVQYNYSHNDMGPGAETTMGSTGAVAIWGPNTIRDNISINDEQGALSTGGGSLQIGGRAVKGSVINVYNNTVYLASNPAIVPACISFLVAPGSGIVANNVCRMGTNLALFYDFGGLTPTGMKFVNNEFYATNGTFAVYSYGSNNYSTFAQWTAVAPGGEAGSNTSNPSFASSPTTVGPCPWTPSADTGPQPCPTRMKVDHTSPAIGHGLNLALSPYKLNVGTRDYYGNPIPSTSGTGYNIGAYGGTE